jgi:luciferase family oxidoreductase group 1
VRPLALSILDLQGDVAETFRLAPQVDKLGYRRYWIAEHPPQPSPILVATVVAALTRNVRVGTAGILLNFYAPFRAAIEFQFLESCFAGRIDAGFGAGAAARPEWNRELLEGRDLDEVAAAYPERVAAFVKHVRNTRGSSTFDAHMAWPGGGPRPPQVWGLGTGARGASLAARHGLHFAYGLLFRHSVDTPSAVEAYRREYVPHPSAPVPHVVVAVAGVCADSEAEAHAMAGVRPEDTIVRNIVGDPESCVHRLAEIAERYQADEIVFADLCPGYEQRLRCYRLLADAAGLGRRVAMEAAVASQ